MSAAGAARRNAPLRLHPAAQSADLARSLKDERGALAAGRRAGGASLTDLARPARV